MELLNLIKKRATVRKYTKKRIPNKYIEKIVEAGIWGPSIHGFQPWRFVVIKSEFVIRKFNALVVKKLERITIPAFLTYPTFATLKNAKVLICVYNSKRFSATMKNFNDQIFKNFELAEISAISACIQNMILEIERLKLGSCWLDLPLFCRKEINELLKEKGDLIAVLTVGYPLKKGIRVARIKKTDSVAYIN
jgi:nitroreductase